MPVTWHTCTCLARVRATQNPVSALNSNTSSLPPLQCDHFVTLAIFLALNTVIALASTIYTATLQAPYKLCIGGLQATLYHLTPAIYKAYFSPPLPSFSFSSFKSLQ
jgi:hypothetical protein